MPNPRRVRRGRLHHAAFVYRNCPVKPERRRRGFPRSLLFQREPGGDRDAEMRTAIKRRGRQVRARCSA